jgi:uncharacterized coiled-coil protein SlyX
VADRTIDELLEAIETVQILKETIGEHAQSIARIADRLESLEKRLDTLAASRSTEPLE